MHTLQTERWVHNDNTVREGSPTLRGDCSVLPSFLKHMVTLKNSNPKGNQSCEIFFFNVIFPFPELGEAEKSDGEKDKKENRNNRETQLFLRHSTGIQKQHRKG